MPAPDSVWSRWKPKEWTAYPPPFQSIIPAKKDDQGKVVEPAKLANDFEVVYRETGSTAALIDILGGSVSGTQKEAVIAELVVTSVLTPPISHPEFYALPITHRAALVAEILNHVSGGDSEQEAQGFSEGSKSGPEEQPEVEEKDETPAGGSGARLKVSVSGRPKR